MLFPYRNDVRKVLIPYLENLEEENWLKKSEVHPNNIAWIVTHIAHSEDFWVNEVGFKHSTILTSGDKKAAEILADYVKIREHTDKLLQSLSSAELDRVVEVPAFSDGWIPPSQPTLRWLFHHVYTHEAYHVGQIGVLARINGFSGPHF